MATDERADRRRTEGQTEVVKLLVALRNFAENPNNFSITNLVWKPFYAILNIQRDHCIQLIALSKGILLNTYNT